MKRGGRLKAGKKTRANQKANAQLAKDYIASGLPQYCEGRFPHDCTRSQMLTWAHNAKRRKRPDLSHAALLCQNGHYAIEVLPPDEMRAIVDEIVEARKLAA